MTHDQYRARYWKKRMEDPLPPLPEDERIYFAVAYPARGFAKLCHCGFDAEKKLWFTGSLNANLHALVCAYDVHPATSEKAMKLLIEKVGEVTMSTQTEGV